MNENPIKAGKFLYQINIQKRIEFSLQQICVEKERKEAHTREWKKNLSKS